MSRKKVQYKPPYMDLDFRSMGNQLLRVTAPYEAAKAAAAPLFSAQMRVAVGTDRLSVATTLVEVARDLLRDDKSLHGLLEAVGVEMVLVAIKSAGRFIEKEPDNLPF